MGVITTMGLEAAGAYLETQRKELRMSRAYVAGILRTNEKQIERIDAGDIDTRSSLLLGYARLVRANVHKLTALLLDVPVPDESFWDEFDQLAPEQQQAVINVIRQMTRGK